MFRKSLLILALSAVVVVLVHGQNRRCILQDTCEKCLTADPSCAWCTDRNYNMKKPRCMTPDELLSANCGQGQWFQRKVESISVLENKESRDYSSTNSGDAIQIQPQKLRMTLAKGVARQIFTRDYWLR